MSVQLSFYGGAGNVTGSRYLLDVDGFKILIDCGLYQEWHLKERNWQEIADDPAGIAAVLLTHAHLDHCGLLPRLVRQGFAGKIYSTPATCELARIVLLDAGHIQEEDAAYKAKRHRKEGRTDTKPAVPLYTVADAEAVQEHFAPVAYEKPITLNKDIVVSFHEAGHILGSSAIRVEFNTAEGRRSLVFSGDLGRDGTPILRDPAWVTDADYVVCESTYGDRDHQPAADINDELAEAINTTHRAGGKVLIPSFSIERSQELLYYLNELQIAKAIPAMPVYLDSPMAIRATEVFKKHPELFDREMNGFLSQGKSPFDLQGLVMTRTAEESKKINFENTPSIIIAGSGMCTGGRIKHHLLNYISQKQHTILFVGYQAVGTLGRHILEGKNPVRILGQSCDVKARVKRIHGFSAHADRNELLAWLEHLENHPRMIFVTHGEEGAAKAFASMIMEKTDFPASTPAFKQRVELL